MNIIDLDAHKRRQSGSGDSPDIPGNERHVDEQARDWVIRLDSGEMSDVEKQALANWLEQDSGHRKILYSFASTWMALDDLSGMLDQLPLPQPGEHNTLLPQWLLTRQAAAVAILLILALPLGIWTGKDSMTFPLEEYITSVGEVRDIDLPDKSLINLNSGSLMTVSYANSARFVHLLDGEAYFNVATNPDVPFVVYAGEYLIRAVGTEFSVSNFQNTLDVIVTEGEVQVSAWKGRVATMENLVTSIEEGSEDLIPLSVGQKGVFPQGAGNLESVQKLETVNLNKSLAWRDGMLIFDNDSLDTVVAQINRYTSGRIVISDSRLSDLRFGGYFRIGDIEAVLDAMEEEYSIEVEEVNDGVYYLSSREN